MVALASKHPLPTNGRPQCAKRDQDTQADSSSASGGLRHVVALLPGLSGLPLTCLALHCCCVYCRSSLSMVSHPRHPPSLQGPCPAGAAPTSGAEHNPAETTGMRQAIPAVWLQRTDRLRTRLCSPACGLKMQ